jgi:phospholipase/carboxylesterase
MELHYTAHVPAGHGPFPTIVAAHGWGANAHDLLGLAPYLHGGQALVLCPEGPLELEAGPGLIGHGWFPITQGAPPDPEAFAEGARVLGEFIDRAVETYPVDTDRLVILGFSQGGVMAYDLALRQPERFAGLVALSSWLPGSLAQSIPKQDALSTLPTLVVHGSQDPMIDIERGHASRDALLELGVPTTYREYEMGHEIQAETLRDLVEWLEMTVFKPVLAV